jgi:hypothetical protein
MLYLRICASIFDRLRIAGDDELIPARAAGREILIE